MLLFLVLLGAIDAPVRRPLNDEESMAFAAVGRIVSSVQGGSGTASMVDDDTLLTAAHLFFEENGALKGALEEYAFQTGDGLRCALVSVVWKQPWDVASAKISCASVPSPAPTPTPTPLSLADSDLAASGFAVLVGYHGDLGNGWVRHIQSCHFARMSDGALVSNCEGYPISSGSPLLVRTGRGWQVAGVMIGIGMPGNGAGQPDWFNRYSLLHPVI